MKKKRVAFKLELLQECMKYAFKPEDNADTFTKKTKTMYEELVNYLN